MSLLVAMSPRARSTTISVAIGVGDEATQADGTYKLAVITTPLSGDMGVSNMYDRPRQVDPSERLSGAVSETRRAL